MNLKIINIIIIKYLFVILFWSDNLKYMFLDESGDLGFKKKSSSHFIVVVVVTERPKQLYNCISRRKAKLSKKHGLHIHELKNVPKKVDIDVLKCIGNKNLSINYISLEKKYLPHTLQNKKVIQPYMIGRLLSEVVKNLEPNERLNLVIDKFLPESKIEDFNNYIDHKVANKKIEINHETSHSNNGLQATHIVVKGINKFYRDNDSSYYDIISKKIDLNIETDKIRL